MMKPAICIDPLYPELAPEQKVEKVATLGFQYIEFWGWRDKNIPVLLDACDKHDVNVVNFSGQRVGSLVAKETHKLVLDDLADAVATAEQLGCSLLMLLTNELAENGSVLDTFDGIPDQEKYENVVQGLKHTLKATPQEIRLVLEPLNIKIDHPGYYLQDMKTAASIIHDVGDARLKILCDLYHLGVMGDDLDDVITNFLPDIGYFHVADFPGRHEPGTGSADWASLLKQIKGQGYTGYIGFEYFPQNDSEESLIAIKELWDTL